MTQANSVASLVTETCKKFPTHVALKIGSSEVSYEELLTKSNIVAKTLIARGACKEAIGIVGQRKASCYFGVFGTMLAGCYYTPVNPKYNRSRLDSILKDAGIRFLIGDYQDLLELEFVLGRNELADFSAVIIPEGRSQDRSNWIDEGAFEFDSDIIIEDLCKTDDLAYLLYTSGSTGTPKGVQVSHANVLAFLTNMSSIYMMEPGFRASQTFDFSFDPSVSDMFFTWMQGGILCVLPEEESLIPFDYIQREKITFWNSVPTVAIFMHKMGYLKPGCFPDLTHSMFCGEQFPQHIGDAWRKAAPNSSIENLYGPTEATIYISRYIYTKIDEKNKFKNGIVPIGRPFLSHDVAIIGDDSRRASPGKSGEIVFTGPQITRGYLHDKEKTDRVFVSFDWDEKGRTWYKTGDLGFINSNGDLECIGRIDNQVKLAGRRIELGEIEAALRKYPQLQDAVVVPIFDEAKVVCACVAFTTNLLTESNETSIRKDIVQYLERVFFPKKIIHIELFPTTESGKTDRKTLAFMAKEYFPVVPSAS